MFWTTVGLLILLTAIWIAYENVNLGVTEIKLEDKNIPSGFDGFRIAHLSDLHNSRMGKDNGKLINMLKKSSPDIIVITGDMIDSRRTNVNISLRLAEELVKIAPVYFVCGNHESRIKEYNRLIQGLEACGVNVINDKIVELTEGGDTVCMIGVKDPAFIIEPLTVEARREFILTFSRLVSECEGYKIMLIHRPEYFERYVESGVNMVFCGHAHGGQFFLPIIGGLNAPGQGFFPKYYRGVYQKNGTRMVVSRGIGNSLFPFRLNNNPEIVVATLSGVIK